MRYGSTGHDKERSVSLYTTRPRQDAALLNGSCTFLPTAKSNADNPRLCAACRQKVVGAFGLAARLAELAGVTWPSTPSISPRSHPSSLPPSPPHHTPCPLHGTPPRQHAPWQCKRPAPRALVRLRSRGSMGARRGRDLSWTERRTSFASGLHPSSASNPCPRPAPPRHPRSLPARALPHVMTAT